MNFVDTSLFKFINDQLTMGQSWSELSLFGFYHSKLSESMLNINRFCCCCLIWRNFLNTEASVKQKAVNQTVQFWWLHLDCLNFTNNSCHAWEEWVRELQCQQSNQIANHFVWLEPISRSGATSRGSFLISCLSETIFTSWFIQSIINYEN